MFFICTYVAESEYETQLLNYCIALTLIYQSKPIQFERKKEMIPNPNGYKFSKKKPNEKPEAVIYER